MKYSDVKNIARYLNDELKGKRLSKFIQHDVGVFSCKVDNKKPLVFAMLHGDPRIYYGDTALQGSGISSTISTILRKSFSNALVLGISQIENDRVLRIDLSVINEVFKSESASIVLEFIPNRPNLILLDNEDKIIFALKMTTLDDKHPVVKSMHYLPPQNESKQSFPDAPFDVEGYLNDCLEKEKILIEAKNKRRYAPLFNKVKNLKKSSDRKYFLIEKDIEEARKHLIDADYGTLLLTYCDELDCSSGLVNIDGLELKVDPRLSTSKNAELYFKRYKKAKSTIAKGEENLARARKEKEEAEGLEIALMCGDDELLNSLLEGLNKNKKVKTIQPASFLPFETNVLNKRVLFGKNAVQNEFVSFHMVSNKEYYWFHVKDVPGAHLILESETPTDKELQLCCELVLLASSYSNGEVQYTKRKNIRKGKTKGQVILGSYQSTYIRQISSAAKQAYQNIKRIQKID